LQAGLVAALLALSGCATAVQGVSNSATTFDDGSASASWTARPAPAGEGEAAGGQAAASEGRALISFAGDCTLSNIQDMDDFGAVYGEQGPAYFLSGVVDIFAADDLTVVNLEGPLTNNTVAADKGEPPVFWFRSPPEYVQILLDGDVEVCNLANNHTLDYGYDGFNQTKEVLQQAGIEYFVYDDVLVREVNGIKVGFFGFAFDSDAGNIQAAMDNLWSDGAEVIIAYFHDGIESTYTPSASQINAAHAAIDYGAQAVIMSHTHCLQGIEEYNGRPIAYSLGNFCYGGHTNPSDKDTMIFQLQLARTDGGFDVGYKVIPCSISGSSAYNDYRPVVLGGEEQQRVFDKIATMSAALGTTDINHPLW
jgi:poly-gamma-glutamate synthesis protein (capsule biosynthesis protein)